MRLDRLIESSISSSNEVSNISLSKSKPAVFNVCELSVICCEQVMSAGDDLHSSTCKRWLQLSVAEHRLLNADPAESSSRVDVIRSQLSQIEFACASGLYVNLVFELCFICNKHHGIQPGIIEARSGLLNGRGSAIVSPKFLASVF